jgi:hypothetical protein
VPLWYKKSNLFHINFSGLLKVEQFGNVVLLFEFHVSLLIAEFIKKGMQQGFEGGEALEGTVLQHFLHQVNKILSKVLALDYLQ